MKLNSDKASKVTETKPSLSFNLIIKERFSFNLDMAVKVLSVARVLCGTSLSGPGKVRRRVQL